MISNTLQEHINSSDMEVVIFTVRDRAIEYFDENVVEEYSSKQQWCDAFDEAIEEYKDEDGAIYWLVYSI